MLNTYLRRQAEIVNRHGGDIDKFVGDELVAVFQGDDMAVHAVRAGVEIQQRMAELREEHPDWNVQVGVGINTGEVVLGAMGSEERMDYTILGDHVNLGARLCSAAAAGQVLLSQHSYRLVADVGEFDITPLTPIAVKGKAEPIPIYAVKGYRQRPG